MPRKYEKCGSRHDKSSDSFLKQCFYHLRSNAKKRNINFNLTCDYYLDLRHDWKCYYCGNDDKFSIDRKDNNKGYTKNNSAACCFYCNQIKSNKFFESEMLRVGELFKQFRIERG